MATSELQALLDAVVAAAQGDGPLTQAVREGMSVKCEGIGETNGFGIRGSSDRRCRWECGARWPQGQSHPITRVPLTIPEAWPEQWARDAVCGGVTGVLLALPDWIVDTQPKVADAYVLVGERDAPGALRALEAALREETGKQ